MDDNKTLHPKTAWKWVVGGVALAIVGLIILAFVLGFDIPVEGRAGGFLLLTPLGLGIACYGLIVFWRERARRKPHQ